MKFLKNKHGGIDFEEKYKQLGVKMTDHRDRLLALKEDMEVLKELQFEFDGYTSDTGEETFIERLDTELNELGDKHSRAFEDAE